MEKRKFPNDEYLNISYFIDDGKVYLDLENMAKDLYFSRSMLRSLLYSIITLEEKL